MTIVPNFPAWIVMWLLAAALYAASKCATIASSRLSRVPFGSKVAYVLLFPGMNATTFCTSQIKSPTHSRAILRCVANALLGSILLWGLARLVPHHPILQGWIGMIGLVLLLHFGLLQLISIAWRAAGIDAPLLMDHHIRATSVTEFWGRRWNTAFRHLSHQFIFKPLTQHIGPRAAMLTTFVASGLIHDLVISVPAGAGFGLPTAYFLLQALAVHFERVAVGRRWLVRPLAGRVFTFTIVVLPAPLLFHIPFVTRVCLPFMVAIEALPREAFP